MELVHVPAKDIQVVKKVTCDLCGAEIKRADYSAEEVEVRHKTGDAYPDNGQGLEVSVDMCGKCFDEKLLPWLRSQGATPERKTWSY